MKRIELSNPRMYAFLLTLAVATHIGFQGWRTLLNNFAVESAGLSGLDMGLVQSVREVPGFLALLAVFVIMIMREHRLAALSTLVMGIGVALTGLFPSVGGLIITTLIMSFGFHYFETMNQSLTLQHFTHTEAPMVMARIRSWTAVTNVSVGVLIFVAARFMGYTELFAIVGAVAIVIGGWLLTKNPVEKESVMQRKELFLKRKYWLYYVLTFLSGARRQIFVAFAVFLLVQKFNYSIEAVAGLFVANNVINYFLMPMIGRAVNNFGERKVLSLEYAALALVFLGYAVTESAWVAGALYILDNIFFNFAISIKTFYQKIADPQDIASGMAVGFTINHIAAVFIPALGGLAWMADYRTVFLGAALLAVTSLILVQLIDGQLRRHRLDS